VRMSDDLRQYLESHRIEPTLQAAVADILKNKSSKPIEDIIMSLKRALDEVKFENTSELMGNILVVGCSSGIGLELAKLATTGGLTVYGTCRTASEELSASGIAHILEGIDVSEDACADKIRAGIGDIKFDVVVFNAGIGDANGSLFANGMAAQGLETIDLPNLKRMFEVNTFGMLRMAQALVPSIKRNGGRWCTIGTALSSFELTLHGEASSDEMSPLIAYRSSKGAAMMITQCLAGPLKKEGIAVSCIHPGAGATSLTTGGLSDDGKPIIPPGMEGTVMWPSELAKGVMLCIKKTTLETTGSFLDGQYGNGVISLPW